MSRTNFEELLDAGCHFGHLTRKWNPAMAPYIFMERNDIHIIDLHKTVVKIDEAAEALKAIAKSGRKILFVATKKQAKEVVTERAEEIDMPYITERWAGGMLTNFPTIRKAVKKMSTIDKMMTDGTFDNISKREKLQISRQREKLEKNLGSIVDLTRLPSAVFIVDVMKEQIAVREAQKLGIPIFAIVDTNSDPKGIDFVIPANDDATKSINVIVTAIAKAVNEGLEERKVEKVDDPKKDAPVRKERKQRVARRPRAKKEDAPVDEEKATEKTEKPAEKAKKAVEKTAKPAEKKAEEKPAAKTDAKVEEKPAEKVEKTAKKTEKPVAKKTEVKPAAQAENKAEEKASKE